MRPMLSAFAVVAALTCAHAAAADEATLVSVRFAGAPPPSGTALDDQDMDLVGGTYRYRYVHAAGGNYIRSVVVRARYDAAVEVLPLRLWPGLAAASATVYRPGVVVCSRPVVQPLQQATGDRDTALSAYFTAAAIYALQGPTGCGPIMRREVAKAWFDRSYELVTLADYFQLSEAAARAYETYDPAYVQRYRDQAQSIALRIATAARQRALASNDVTAAKSLHDLVVGAAAGPEGGRLAALQALTPERLLQDGRFIDALAARTDTQTAAASFAGLSEPADERLQKEVSAAAPMTAPR